MNVNHRIKLIKADTGKHSIHFVPGIWNEEGSGGPSFSNKDGLYSLLNCQRLELTTCLIEFKEYDLWLDEEGLYAEGGPIINQEATQLQKDWCTVTNRQQLCPIVGDIGIDLGLDIESLEKVSQHMETNNDRENNTIKT